MNKRIRKKQLKKLSKYIPHSDTYNLDITVAKFILPRLELFRKIIDCFPDKDFNSLKEWQDTLDKMINAFRIISKKFESNDSNKSDEEKEVVKEGLDLFRKYYHDLWW